MSDPRRTVDPKRVTVSIQMLKLYIAGEEITPLISVLESIAENPGDEALLVRLSDVFGNLGIVQGAVLTYAPYLMVILPHDLLKNMD